MRNSAPAIARRLALIVAVVVGGLVPGMPAFGQDSPASRPLFEGDTSGRGAVLCVWSIYLIVRARAAACGLAREPIDDAIDEGIDAMEVFIMANSSQHPTREMLEAFKRRATESDLAVARRDPKTMCQHSLVVDLRKTNPDQFRERTKWMLAIPRQPLMNPCL
jgi:hypothetical protein